MDGLCRLGLGAVAGALVHAGIETGREAGCEEGARGGLGERAGVIVGTAHGCHAANETFYRGFLAQGMLGASPRVFSYTLPSSPAGEISIRYGISGPCEAFVSGRHSGVEALGRAGVWCERGTVDLALVAAVEVGGGTLAGLGLAVCDQAVALVIEGEAAARRRGARVWAVLEGSAGAFRRGAPEVALAAAVGRLDGAVDGGMLRSEVGSPGSDGACGIMMVLVRWLEAGGMDGECVRVGEVDPEGGAAVIGVRRVAVR